MVSIRSESSRGRGVIQSSNIGRWLGAALALVFVSGAGVYYFQHKAPPAKAPAATATAAAEPEPKPEIRYPIDEGAAETKPPAEPLPALDESDKTILETLAGLPGMDQLAALLFPEHIIPHIVATIDNLPRAKAAPLMMPVRPVPGLPLIAGSGAQRNWDAKNAGRYAPYMRIVDALDAKTAVAWYVRFYPLFQQAYRELGYPHGYFNDRLVEVIDHLLSAPDVFRAPALVQPNVLYEYADPNMEALSAGQKILIRIGPDNAARVKVKLREIRRELTAHAPAKS
jgi:hypothetical protein